jgi:CBS domain-containing membrane protein
MFERLRFPAPPVPPAAIGHLGWLRGALGAAIAIAVAAGLTAFLLGVSGLPFPLPLLVAPLGASAVLVFCVPASPLAQPWAVIGGDLVSAAVGLAMGHAIGMPWLAASLALGLAIAAMSLLRCLHPPGGACALLCALGASGAAHWNWAWMGSIAANVGALVATGWLYNNLTGHPWPHVPVRVPHAPQASYTRADIEALMAEWNEVLDVDIDDLDAFCQALLRKGRGA